MECLVIYCIVMLSAEILYRLLDRNGAVTERIVSVFPFLCLQSKKILWQFGGIFCVIAGFGIIFASGLISGKIYCFIAALLVGMIISTGLAIHNRYFR